MAHVAIPDDDGRVGLDDLEGVLAIYRGGHFDVRRSIRTNVVRLVAKDEAAII